MVLATWKLMPPVPTLAMLEALRHATKTNPYCVGLNHVHRDRRQWELCERVNFETCPDSDDLTVLERFATEDEVRAHYEQVVTIYAYQAMLRAAPPAPAL